MKRPIMPLSIGFGIGILAAYYVDIQSMFLSTLLTLILIYSYREAVNNKGIFVYVVLLMVVLGALNVNSNYNKSLYDFVNKEASFSGVVDSIEKNENGTRYRFALKLVDATIVDEKVLLSFYENTDFQLGQSIRLKGELKIPSENTNPLLFNYRRYLLGKNIEFQLIGNVKTIERLDYSVSLKYELQRYFYNRVETQFSGLKTQNANTIKGLILGANNNQDKGEYDKYKELGIAHILAISGLHIGIIAGFFIFIFSIIGFKRKYNFFLTLLILWIYGFLIGFPPSTLRALIMFTTIIASKLWNKPYDFLNILAFSFIISLTINPFWIFSIGFQLSYIATVSLGLILPKLKELFYPYKSNIADSFLSVLAVNIGIFPVQSFYFNEFPIYTFIANILILPIATINLILGFLNLATDIFVPILDLFLTVQSLIVDYMYKLPIRTFYLSSLEIGEIIVYYILVMVVFKIKKLQLISKTIKKTIFVSLLFLLLVISIDEFKPSVLEIDFIDIGQGDSMLIKKDSIQYLIDTGGSAFGTFDVGERILLPYLVKTGNRDLEGVIITHFDKDHYGALASLINNITIDKVLVGSEIPDLDLKQKLEESKIPVSKLIKDSRITIDKDVRLEVIYPDKDARRSKKENDNSLVILLKAYDKRILFTGDIESPIEEKLVSQGIQTVDILKIPHHGSKTSSTSEFISMLSPRISIISVGRNNSYNHPSEEVIQRLQSFDSKIYRTDTMGLIKVKIDKKRIEIEPYYGPLYRENIIKIFDEYLVIIIVSIVYMLMAYLSVNEYNRLEDLYIELQ
ncbi:MAG: DNA internalization-related competence protein ComEC/Rec2 [Gudongella sp.]|nr:DNA internalization-related competence protein ComEC/Rec2 [Gudongella sp.]